MHGGPTASLDHPPIVFGKSRSGTLGVEVEVQLLERETLQPAQASDRLLRRLAPESGFQPELFLSMLEVCTGVCGSLQEVEADLRRALARLEETARAESIIVIGAGTHPLAALDEHTLYPKPRYRELLERTQWITRRASVYGLHVHVGVESGQEAIELINDLSPYLAPLLALSASSPYLEGKETGLASSRVTAYESHPACGTPPTFRSWMEFERLCDTLRRSDSILSLSDLWWDIRPSPHYGTVEIRICDGQNRLSDCLALVAAVQCLVAWLKTTREGSGRIASTWRLRENKWRAARHGLEADLMVDESGTTRPVRRIWRDLLEHLGPGAARLGCSAHLAGIERILSQGASYQRQREALARTGSLLGVIATMRDEWATDLLA